MDNLWFNEEEIDIMKDSSTFEIDAVERDDVESVSAAHHPQLHEDFCDDEQEFEMSTMHANVEITIPRGEPAKPIVDLLHTAEKSNHMDKVLDFPPISHEPAS